jgi:hypothetical protein
MGTAGAQIGFVCMSSAHLSANGALADHLTIHEKEWAYCPSDIRSNGHDWQATGGVTLGELQIVVRGWRERAAGDGRPKER